MNCDFDQEKLEEKQNENKWNDSTQLDELAKFYSIFVDKLVVFDPLDRPILDDDKKEQAIKREQLLNLLEV